MTRRITCITKLPNHQDRHRRIQAVGGSAWRDSEETAIANVKRDKSAYDVTEQGKTVRGDRQKTRWPRVPKDRE
ncbi:hypothetical protein AB7M46_005197 [Bradyrhizobium elkanii]